MSIPTDLPYCLVYPTSYVKGIDPDHFDTQNSPMGMRLHCCVCRATLHFSNEDPKQCTKYGGSHLIIPRRAQYNDCLYPSILEPQNHHGPLLDPMMGEPCPMEVVGDFKAADPIFKGSYGDYLLYSEDDLADLRWQKVYLPTFQEEIPMPPPCPTSKVGNRQQPSNSHTGQQLWTHPWSLPRLDIPAAKVGLCGAQDVAPIP